MSITSSSVLVDLNMSVWTANRLDRTESNKLTEDNHAVHNAAQVRKNLMAGTKLRKDIADFSAGCTNWSRKNTLPWADRGTRLLPTSLFMDYKTEMNTRRSTFNAMVDEFLQNYPALVQIAGNYLGSLFNASDYPSTEEVATKFGFRLVFSPVPEAGDFRLDIATHEMEELRNSYDVSFKDRLADAVKEPWDRLHTTLVEMSERLTEVEGDGKKLYRESSITNIQALCQMLTHLNITKDPKLEAARRDLETAMLGVDIADIRDSALIRADTKAKMDSILKKYEW